MLRTSLRVAALLLAAGFVRPVSADDKPQTPTVLTPVEFQAAHVRAQLPSMAFVANDKGKFTKVWVLKNPPPKKPGKPLDLTDKIELVDIEAINGRELATEAIPAHMVIVAASFPYKKQVEEFRRKLRLPDDGAVLSKTFRDKAGKPRPAFQFRGLVIERTTLDRNGKEGPWERLMGKLDPKEKPARQPFDLHQVYGALRFQLPPKYRAEKDDPQLQPILAVSRGLVMDIPAQYEPRKAPRPERHLSKIQETVRKLKEIDGKSLRPPFKETPIDHCLIRFLDPSVEPGKAYKYRFKVKMANPLSAAGEELLSAWATLPDSIAIPPDEFVYTVDEAKADPKRWRRAGTPRPSQAVFQIQRWVDFYSTSGGREQGVGDWLVAQRFFVERGEFVRTPPTFTLEVPVHRLDNPNLTLDSRPALRRGDRTTQIPLPFGDNSILVDFEGGRIAFARTEKVGGRIRVTRIEDRTPVEVLIMRPDGKMIARNSGTDAADPVRTKRYKDSLQRVEEARNGPKKPSGSGFDN